jgi:hypothetical protein
MTVIFEMEHIFQGAQIGLKILTFVFREIFPFILNFSYGAQTFI